MREIRRLYKTAWRPPTLTTARLVLRAVRESDAPAIYAYARNPNVARFVLWEAHRSLTDAQVYIRDYIFRHYNDGVPEALGVALRARPDQLIGCVGCSWVSRAHRQMELAYALAEPHWNRGLVTEACQALLNYVFNDFNVYRIQARCKAENLASARVVRKLGMQFEGTLRGSVFSRDGYWDVMYFSLLRDEWARAAWAGRPGLVPHHGGEPERNCHAED